MNFVSEQEGLLQPALRLLRRLSLDRVPPAQAVRDTQVLGQSADKLAVELAWEDEPISGSRNYHLYLSDDTSTVSLGLSQFAKTPWMLRHAQRWSDNHVVRVNGELMDVEKIMPKLDFVWGDTDLMIRIVEDCIVQQEIKRRDLTLMASEMDDALQSFLVRRRLQGQAAIDAWLKARGLTWKRLQGHVEQQRLADKLKLQIVDGAERSYFDSHRDAFDEWSVLAFRSADCAFLQRIKEEVLSVSLSVWLERHFNQNWKAWLDGVDLTLRRVRRGLVELGHEPFLETGACRVCGPCRSGMSFEVAFVIKERQASFDDSIAQLCRDALFSEWLRSEREKANVEWFWGPES
jgi:putative peptide maturation system protein